MESAAPLAAVWPFFEIERAVPLAAAATVVVAAAPAAHAAVGFVGTESAALRVAAPQIVETDQHVPP